MRQRLSRYGMALMALFVLMSLSMLAWQNMRLHDARSRLAQNIQTNASPPPVRSAFSASLEARLKREAVAAALSLTIIEDAAIKTGRDVLVNGPQAAVLAFAERLESGAPGMTLTRWRIEPARDGVLLAMRVEPANGPPRRTYPARLAALPPLFAPVEKGNPAGARPMLVGVAGRLPDDAEALVRAPGGPVRTMRQGDIIIGWQLVEIGPDYISFTRNGQTYVSTLKPLS